MTPYFERAGWMPIYQDSNLGTWGFKPALFRLSYRPKVGMAGIEPATSRFVAGYSVQLSYIPMEPYPGLEPSTPVY